ncbi:MAG: putative sugar O-methyltransferase, partial [Planctomycetes bacterium]|nr:putative sugar O-methyltransferase [Planctomycetota bacterium]
RESELASGLTRGASGPDHGILLRIITAFTRSKQAEHDMGVIRGGPWQRIRSDHMGELTALLEAGRPEPLNDYLRELAIRQAAHGFFQGKPTFDVINASPSSQRQRLLWIADSVCGLAEWLGVMGVACPEGRPTVPAPPPTLDELATRIEDRIGLPIRVPEICGGLFGLASGGGVVHVRSTTAVYAALRIQRSLRDREQRSLDQSRICEIGPGIGLVASVLGRLGAGDLTLVDLPEVNAMQAYFLAQALPNHRLTLFAEPAPPTGPTLRIMPDFECLSGAAGRFDLIFNQDSLPEFDLETVRRYLDVIPRSTRLFLSFNQETRVPIGTPAGAGFLPSLLPDSQQVRCLERSPAWLRAGYVEELFACTAGG